MGPRTPHCRPFLTSVILLLLLASAAAQGRLLDPTPDPEMQGWQVTANIMPPYDVTPGPTEMQVNTIGSGGTPSTLLLFHRDTGLPPGLDWWVEVSLKVLQVQAPHNTFDAGVALFAAYSTGFGSPTERGQMVFFDETLVGWADDSQSYAMSTTDTFHTYRLNVFAAGSATLEIDGTPRLAYPGFATNNRVAFGDQTNDASLDGTFLIQYLDVMEPGASCQVTAPVGGAVVGADVSWVLSADHPAGLPLSTTFEHSTDGGMTWLSCTAGATSPTANPDPPRGTPIAGLTFVWDSRADGVGLLATATMLRATIDDGSVTASCSVAVTVDNVPACTLCGDCNESGSGPDILDALAAAQVSAGLTTPSPTQALCCDVNASGGIDVLDALLIAQDAAGLPVVLVCP